MNVEVFINSAIELGSQEGPNALSPVQPMVFLISEAEVDCDMNGIDTFLNRYGTEWLSETALAFASIGATEIAETLSRMKTNQHYDDALLDKVNDLITSRTGYDYAAIHRAVENGILQKTKTNETL